jgi:hypothetical protein
MRLPRAQSAQRSPNWIFRESRTLGGDAAQGASRLTGLLPV